MDHRTQESESSALTYDLKLYFDHKSSRYLFFYCDNWENSRWWGDYCTEEEFDAMKAGKSPQDLGY
jgi:hypothetical protein